MNEDRLIITPELDDAEFFGNLDRITNNLNALTNRVNEIHITIIANNIEGIRRDFNQIQSSAGDAEDSVAGLLNRLNQADGAADGLRGSLDQVGNTLEDANQHATELAHTMGTVTGIVATTLGALASASATVGVSVIVEKDNAINELKAMVGATEEEANRLKKIVNDVYNQGFGETFDEVSKAVGVLRNNLKGISDEALGESSKAALVIQKLYGESVEDSSRAVRTLTQNFKGLSEVQAFDMIIKGFQEGGNYANDLIDTLHEYAPYFADMGLSAEQFFSILINGARNGAFNLDKVADAVKEFGIRAVDGSKTTQQGFEMIGLDAVKMANDIAQGGQKAQQAFIATVAALSNVDDPLKRSIAGVNLFGTQWEDVKDQVITAMDEAAKNVINFEGTAKKAGETLNEGMSGQLNILKRNLLDAFANSSGPVKEMLDDLIKSFNESRPAIEQAIGGIVGGFVTAVQTIAGLGKFVYDNWSVILPIISGVLGGFLAYKSIGAIVPIVVSLINTVRNAAGAMAAFNAILAANPIGAVATAVGLLIAAGVALYQNWDKVSNFFSQAWSYMKIAAFKAVNAILTYYDNLLGYIPVIGDKIKEARSKMEGFIDEEETVLAAKKAEQAAKEAKENIDATLSAKTPEIKVPEIKVPEIKAPKIEQPKLDKPLFNPYQQEDPAKKKAEEDKKFLEEVKRESEIASKTLEASLGALSQGTIEYLNKAKTGYADLAKTYEQEAARLSKAVLKDPNNTEFRLAMLDAIKSKNEALKKSYEAEAEALVKTYVDAINRGKLTTKQAIADFDTKLKGLSGERREIILQAKVEFEEKKLQEFEDAINKRKQTFQRNMEKIYDQAIKPYERELDLIDKQKQAINDKYDNEINGLKTIIDLERERNKVVDAREDIAYLQEQLKLYEQSTTAEAQRKAVELRRQIRDAELTIREGEIEQRRREELAPLEQREQQVKSQYELAKEYYDRTLEMEMKKYDELIETVRSGFQVFQDEVRDWFIKTEGLAAQNGMSFLNTADFKTNLAGLLAGTAQPIPNTTPALNLNQPATNTPNSVMASIANFGQAAMSRLENMMRAVGDMNTKLLALNSSGNANANPTTIQVIIQGGNYYDKQAQLDLANLIARTVDQQLNNRLKGVARLRS